MRFCSICNCELNKENSHTKNNKCKECLHEMYVDKVIKYKESVYKDLKKQYRQVSYIEGYEDKFLVTDTGKIFRLNKNSYKEIKGALTKNGYLWMVLEKSKDKVVSEYIHRVVAKAFIDNPRNLLCINHKDGNKTNNNIDNLEWCTYSHNNQHAYDNELKSRGEKHYTAKLTEQDVLKIRRLANTHSKETLAKMFNVTASCIKQVVYRRTWKWLKDDNIGIE